jgi:hypothetical protein
MKLYLCQPSFNLETDPKTHGSGAIIVHRPASSAVAPVVPSVLYMAPANSGKTPAKVDLTKALLAMTDAAHGR